MRYTLSCIGFICLFALACTKPNGVSVVSEIPAVKNVTFAVYAGTNYNGSFYDNAKGELELSIAKISNNGLSTQVLWDTIFTLRKLADFPAFQQRTMLQKTFSILDSKEKLQVSYIRKYNFNGALSQMATGTPAANGNTSISYEVDM